MNTGNTSTMDVTEDNILEGILVEFSSSGSKIYFVGILNDFTNEQRYVQMLRSYPN